MYRNGIKPTFLGVFQMMSGLVSPKSVGLTNQSEVNRLLRRSKRSQFLSFTSRYLMAMIERTAEKTVGFTCWQRYKIHVLVVGKQSYSKLCILKCEMNSDSMGTQNQSKAQNKANAIHTKLKLMVMIERMAEKRVDNARVVYGIIRFLMK
ncbi:unnamed protein product [Medioppia subpectinata]|uniref:Uncharacterized protein n=1 Tax=Medioppia subpectinata TaxID=1979941 RepID=A0A7R9PVP5_9ACAR|nr:unnamed protein product [Medioppia subpectinata]CAG2102872.1 unnamed protein product [Medioppia subpectinata]